MTEKFTKFVTKFYNHLKTKMIIIIIIIFTSKANDKFRVMRFYFNS